MPLSKREYYDLLIRSSLDGTFPSVLHNQCRYRGPGGGRCAVGLLIPDERYTPDLEGGNACEYVVQEAVGENTPEGLTYSDLQYVQRVHDTVALRPSGWDPNSFREGLDRMPCFKDLHS